jgi:hypothetical protein
VCSKIKQKKKSFLKILKIEPHILDNLSRKDTYSSATMQLVVGEIGNCKTENIYIHNEKNNELIDIHIHYESKAN